MLNALKGHTFFKTSLRARSEWCQDCYGKGKMGHLGDCSSLGRSVPQLKPILADIEYLQDQHLLLTVKSMDGYESYGEEQEVLRATRNQVAP